MHTQFILTNAPSAYSYHPFVTLDVGNLPDGSLFSKDWPTDEQMDDIENWKPNFDQFIWGYGNLLVDASRIKVWTVIKVQSSWPDQLQRLVDYQADRIRSAMVYVVYVDTAHWEDDDSDATVTEDDQGNWSDVPSVGNDDDDDMGRMSGEIGVDA